MHRNCKKLTLLIHIKNINYMNKTELVSELVFINPEKGSIVQSCHIDYCSYD